MNARYNRKEQSFTEIYDACVDEVYGFIYVRTGFDSVAAEDLTQDVFLAVFKGLEKFAGKSSERTWVFGIARNKLNDFYRSRYAYESGGINEATLISDPKQDTYALALKEFESRVVRDCLERLSPRCQMVLVMKYLDRYSVKQIANSVNLSPKAVESLLQRAKTAFIKEYQTEEL